MGEMSRENVERTQRVMDTFNRRDRDGLLALMDPDIEWTPYEVRVQGGSPYRGHEGMRRWMEESFEVLPDLRVDTHELRDLKNVVYVQGRLHGHGAGSGAPFERTLWELLEWRDGKVVWGSTFGSEPEALEGARQRDERDEGRSAV